MADILLKSDRVEPALEILHDLLSTRDHQVFALCRIAEFEKADLQNAIVQNIGELLKQSQSTLTDEDRVALYLAYGNAAERSSEFDLAFQSWEKAHAIDLPPYDSGQIEAAYKTNMEFYTESLFQRTRSSANPSHAPVFVMGMPRSGTTLVEQILGAHAQCEGVGETGRMVFMNTAFLNKYYRPGGAEALSENVAKGELVTRGDDFLSAARLLAGHDAHRFIDKTPTQFVAAGYIHLCLPHAKFINMERHPADIFISTYQNQFSRSSAFPWTQERFVHFYLEREKLLKHWRSLFGQQILDVRYEDVASDPEPQIRRMLEFLELEWDPACMRFQEHGKTIHTFSRQQVRGAINTKSVHRWRNYEKHLESTFFRPEKAGYKYEGPMFELPASYHTDFCWSRWLILSALLQKASMQDPLSSVIPAAYDLDRRHLQQVLAHNSLSGQIQLAQNFHDRYPDDAFANSLMAALLGQTRDKIKAIPFAQRAVQRSNFVLDYVVLLFRLYIDFRFHEQIAQLLKALPALPQNSAQFEMLLGKYYLDIGE